MEHIDCTDDKGNDWGQPLDGLAATALLHWIDKSHELIKNLYVTDQRYPSLAPKSLIVSDGRVAAKEGDVELSVAEYPLRFKLTDSSIRSICEIVRKSSLTIVENAMDEYRNNSAHLPKAKTTEISPRRKFQRALAAELETSNYNRVTWGKNRVRIEVEKDIVLKLFNLARAAKYTNGTSIPQLSRTQKAFIKGNEVAQVLTDAMSAAYRWEIHQRLKKEDPAGIGAYALLFAPEQCCVIIYDRTGANDIREY